MNLESHGCGDETVILFVINVEHSEWSAVLNVSIAAQFDAIGGFAEDESRLLEWHACSEFTIEQAELWVSWCCWCILDCCQHLRQSKARIFSFKASWSNYTFAWNNLRLMLQEFSSTFFHCWFSDSQKNIDSSEFTCLFKNNVLFTCSIFDNLFFLLSWFCAKIIFAQLFCFSMRCFQRVFKNCSKYSRFAALYILSSCWTCTSCARGSDLANTWRKKNKKKIRRKSLSTKLYSSENCKHHTITSCRKYMKKKRLERNFWILWCLFSFFFLYQRDFIFIFISSSSMLNTFFASPYRCPMSPKRFQWAAVEQQMNKKKRRRSNSEKRSLTARENAAADDVKAKHHMETGIDIFDGTNSLALAREWMDVFSPRHVKGVLNLAEWSR